jgi:uncharacterized protein
MAYRSVTITLLGLAGAALLTKNGEAGSFDCQAAATPTEKAICANSQLSSLDDQTSAMYYATLGASLPAATLSAVKSAQVKFLQQRDSCGADVNCLVDAYTSRITYLKQAEKEFPPSTGDWTTFTSPTSGFSISYPRAYTVDPAYNYQDFGGDTDISGVSFTIPETMTKNTNLASDTHVSVETLPHAASCTADLFLSEDPSGAGKVHAVKESDTEYSVMQASEGAAGNVYDQYLYALIGSSPCLAVRYFIHSGEMGAYDATVHAFDRPALLSQFERIRKSLVIGQ